MVWDGLDVVWGGLEVVWGVSTDPGIEGYGSVWDRLEYSIGYIIVDRV